MNVTKIIKDTLVWAGLAEEWPYVYVFRGWRRRREDRTREMWWEVCIAPREYGKELNSWSRYSVGTYMGHLSLPIDPSTNEPVKDKAQIRRDFMTFIESVIAQREAIAEAAGRSQAARVGQVIEFSGGTATVRWSGANLQWGEGQGIVIEGDA